MGKLFIISKAWQKSKTEEKRATKRARIGEKRAVGSKKSGLRPANEERDGRTTVTSVLHGETGREGERGGGGELKCM